MTEREMKRQYKELVENIEDAQMFDGRNSGVDVYTCKECGAKFYTKYAHKGVTPFVIGCKACGKGCANHNQTISEQDWRKLEAQGEKLHYWVRPTIGQLRQLSPGLLDHVLQGGLVLLDIDLAPVRKPKFRGRTPDGQWVTGDIAHITPYDTWILPEKTWDRERVDVDTVGQFTEMHDKDGKEIYEGDILDLYIPKNVVGKPEHRLRKVIWKDSGFYITNKDGDCIMDRVSSSIELIYTVIGNIHDNPELLR